MNQIIEQDYDACICGGGIAGLVTAYALGKSGRKILLVEKNAAFNPNGADVLKPSGIDVLEKLGLFKDLLDNGAIIRDKVLIYYGGELVSDMDYKNEHTRKYFMLIPYINVLNMMLNAISKIKNIHIMFNTELTSAKIDECTGNVNQILLNEKVVVRAKVYIAADGIFSRLRSILAVPTNMERYSQQLYFAQFPIVESVRSFNRLYVDKDHMLAYFYPVGKDYFRSVIGMSKETGDYHFRQGQSVESLRNRLSGFVTASDDALEAITSVEKFVTFPLCKMNLEKYYTGNVVFIGNSAHSIHPITGQGMNLAIEDAGALSPLLNTYFEDVADLTSVLEKYQHLRHAVNDMMVRYGDNLVNSFDLKAAFLSNLNLRLQTSNRRSKAVFQRI
jgi:2-polyprenyl-6-methoxyphenol hydroxylase-like FAD-dependent oxidoreductase